MIKKIATASKNIILNFSKKSTHNHKKHKSTLRVDAFVHPLPTILGVVKYPLNPPATSNNNLKMVK